MARVKALFGMEHSGTRKKGDIFEVSDKIADELLRRGLVSRLRDEAPDSDKAASPAENKAAATPSNKTARSKAGRTE